MGKIKSPPLNQVLYQGIAQRNLDYLITEKSIVTWDLEKSQLNYWLSFLRFLSIFTLLLLIINPSIKKNSIEIAKPNLLVAVDNSKSIKNNLQDKNVENF